MDSQGPLATSNSWAFGSFFLGLVERVSQVFCKGVLQPSSWIWEDCIHLHATKVDDNSQIHGIYGCKDADGFSHRLHVLGHAGLHKRGGLRSGPET